MHTHQIELRDLANLGEWSLANTELTNKLV